MLKPHEPSAHWLTRYLFFLALTAVGARTADAAIIFDSGDAVFSATGTQFGRLFRDGTSSDWSGPKPFPGVSSAPAARAYEAFNINVGDFPFIQVNLDNPAANLFSSGYLSSYNPVNSAPNYGLDVNYLGDAGSSQPFGNPSFFQIVVASNSDIVIVVNEVNSGGGTAAQFRLIVEGFYDTEYNDVPGSGAAVPEPAAATLVLLGLAVFAGLKKRSRSQVSSIRNC